MLCLTGKVYAQNEEDALRYSRLDFGGTARTQGIGGVQTAIGADAGNLSGNPAGLGLFRRSEFSLSPAISGNNTSSVVGGSTSVDQRNNLNFSNFGVIFANRKSDGEGGGWRGGAFGIGFTRQNTFHNKFNYSNLTGETDFSIVESIAEKANRFGLSTNGNLENLEDLAYETYIIDYDNTNQEYFAVNRQGRIQQSEDVLSKGAQNQWDFSYGASYKDKLYVGASLGLSSLRFTQQRIYREVENNPNTPFQNLTLRDDLTTTGNGLNARLGLIYRPLDLIRFGASFQTPTYFSMHDDYSTSLDTRLNQSYSESTDPGEYQYNLTTPMRATGGVAVFLNKYGFISGDVEYVDYSSARLKDPADNAGFQGINNTISTKYASAVNLRLGAEGRFDIFRVRAGYALYGSPYKNDAYDRQKSFVTLGGGIRQANRFFDVAFVNTAYNSVYSPYTISDNSQPVVVTKNRYNNLLFTFGINF